MDSRFRGNDVMAAKPVPAKHVPAKAGSGKPEFRAETPTL